MLRRRDDAHSEYRPIGIARHCIRASLLHGADMRSIASEFDDGHSSVAEAIRQLSDYGALRSHRVGTRGGWLAPVFLLQADMLRRQARTPQ